MRRGCAALIVALAVGAVAVMAGCRTQSSQEPLDRGGFPTVSLQEESEALERLRVSSGTVPDGLHESEWDVIRSVPVTEGGRLVGIRLSVALLPPVSTKGPWTSAQGCRWETPEPLRVPGFEASWVFGGEVIEIYPWAPVSGEGGAQACEAPSTAGGNGAGILRTTIHWRPSSPR